ncbi:DUF881 domain-containing protein [Nocardioides montaniterrae]
MPERLDRTRTPLLTLITLQSLDEDYVTASERRTTAGASASSSRLRGGAVVAALLFGLLVAVAAVQNSREAGVDDASRAGLIQRIEARRASVAATERQLARLRSDNAKADSSVTKLGSQVSAAKARDATYAALTGLGAVSGPALRITLASSPYADRDNQVRDSDVALLVNALWGAGAEAITVNGERVTARTGIRTSGTAIEVNGVGVAPPYTVLAIGDTDSLSADFLTSAGGQDFVALAGQYDFSYGLHDVGRVTMAAAPASLLKLLSAQALAGEDHTSGNHKKARNR